MAKKNKAKIDFDVYYTEIFGERWAVLKKNLSENPYSVKIQFHESLSPYYMDAGSLFAASALPLDKAKTVLDLCAAPGGKSLVLAASLENTSSLIANELSMQRRERLLSVLQQSLPENILEKVRVTPYDGRLMHKRNKEQFDAILCDLPCSSERHVLASPKHFQEWSTGRIKNLSYTQGALLSSAFLMLKPEGFLLYATCALTKMENDDVIEKLLKKNTNATVLDLEVEGLKEKIQKKHKLWLEINPEKTEYGYHILPDSSNGAGPLYLSLIQKVL